MRYFPLPELQLSPENEARLTQAIGDTHVFWLPNIAADPIGAMEQGGLSGTPLVVGDTNTLAALNAQWHETQVLEVPSLADATETLASQIKAKAEAIQADYLIAVGSGTINDLCKYAASQLGKRYGVIPTAPTMNGFVSANASISINGMKHSLPAAMPKVVACDADILSAAPRYMHAAGFSDAISRFTAQTDWYMAHLMVETPYDPLPFQMQAQLDEELALSAGALGRGNNDATKILMNSLLVSGLGMVVNGSSMPASQAEHMIAHTLDLSPTTGQVRPNKVLHGEQIAITTLSMCLLQRTWLDSPTSRWLRGDWKRRARERYWAAPTKIAGYFGPQLANDITKEFNKKMVSDRSFEQLLERFGSKWDGMRAEIDNNVMRWSPRQLHQMLQAVGASTNPGNVGWHQAQYNAAVRYAHFYRSRWTFLDLIYFFGPDRPSRV